GHDLRSDPDRVCIFMRPRGMAGRGAADGHVELIRRGRGGTGDEPKASRLERWVNVKTIDRLESVKHTGLYHSGCAAGHSFFVGLEEHADTARKSISKLVQQYRDADRDSRVTVVST